MTFKQGDGWRLLRGAEGDSEVGGEDVTQGSVRVDVSGMLVEVEV